MDQAYTKILSKNLIADNFDDFQLGISFKIG